MKGELKEPEATIRFRAKLVQTEGSGKIESCVLTLPRAASSKVPSPAETVEGTINGFPFRRPLKRNLKGAHSLEVNEAMLDGAGAKAGGTVTVEITRVGEEPEIRTPMELRKTLEAAPEAKALWYTITPMARRDWILWITSARQEKTRQSRIEKACDMLASGKRRVCCFGGLNWLLKDYGTSGGVWQPLPK